MNDRGSSSAAGAYRDLEPLPVPVHDNHTHLNFSDDIPSWADGEEPPGLAEAIAALDAASAVGVAGVVQVGTNVADSRWAVALAERDPRVLAAVAIHPNDAPALAADGVLEDALASLDALAAHPRVRALGETGLDWFRLPGSAGGAEASSHVDRARAVDAQVASFEAHIDIAKRHGLAIQIHDRDAHADVLAVLERVGAPERTVLHCFSGDADFARRALEAGCYLSFAGTVTFKNAGYLREALVLTPLDRILVETDAPFLTPHPFRGRQNAPAMIPVTLRAMADTRGIDVAELGTAVAANALAVYGSWD